MKKNYKKLIILFGLVTSICYILIIGLSLVYDTPFEQVITRSTKKIVLEAIEKGVRIFDPSDIIQPDFYPTISKDIRETLTKYSRIEDIIYNFNHLKITKNINHPNEKSSYIFHYQPCTEPKLQELRITYDLDKIISRGHDELEKMILLRQWSRGQFERKDYQPFMKNFNALQILEGNVTNQIKDKTYRPCHLFPLLYAQVLASMGYTARIVTISFEPDHVGHGNVEVWSNQFNKWIAMDADLNLHYVSNDIPLNFLELHNFRYKNADNLKIIYGTHGSDGISTVEQTFDKPILDMKNMINYASYFSISDMRNDWLTNHYFKGHPVRSSVLLWYDEKLPNQFMPFDKTSNEPDMYWSLNRTEIHIRPEKNQNEFEVYFNTFTPCFDFFEYRINEGQKRVSKQPFIKWELSPGKNTISVVAVNKLGVKGVESYIEIHKQEPNQ